MGAEKIIVWTGHHYFRQMVTSVCRCHLVSDVTQICCPHARWDLAQKFAPVVEQRKAEDALSQQIGRKVKWPHHEADYWKVYQVYEMGGIGMDFDQIAVNRSEMSKMLASAKGNVKYD